jgi:hypothetical protein
MWRGMGSIAGDPLLNEGWGVEGPQPCLWADRFARASDCALAIDFYDGRVTDDRPVAAAWMRELGQAQADAKLVTALDGLAVDGRPVAAFGFSLGGGESLAVTFLRLDLVGATVVGYCHTTAEEELGTADRRRFWKPGSREVSPRRPLSQLLAGTLAQKKTEPPPGEDGSVNRTDGASNLAGSAQQLPAPGVLGNGPWGNHE